MNLKTIPIAAMLLGCTLAVPGLLGSANAQPGKDIPPSEEMEHEGDLAYLGKLAERPGPVGAAAKNMIEIFKGHMATEEEFILPPLTLLPKLAAGTVSPDMKWAIADADRLKAEQASIQATHQKITDGLLALKDAAQEEHDANVEGFASDLAADDLADVDITEPTVLLIGEFLRQKLPAQ
jgi:hypothetical protein